MKLNKSQKVVYDMDKYAGGSISVICGSMLVNGRKDLTELKAAVNELYRLNDALRIHVSETDNGVEQYVADYAQQEIEVLSFAGKAELNNYANNWAKVPIDMFGSLCDVKVILLPDSYGILVKLHHLIGDAWTLSLIGSQFNAILNGETPEVYSYIDYIEAENTYLESKRYIKDRDFFLEQFKKCDEVTYISEKQNKTFASDRKTFVIDAEKAKIINDYITSHETSAFMLFTAALSAYINRTKMNIEKFYIGTAVLNRSNNKEKNTAGMFINTVPMLIELDNNVDFKNNLLSIEDTAFSVFRHQKYNYGDLLGAIRKEFNFTEKLYDVMLSYQNATIAGETDFESTWYHCGMQNESLQIHIDDRDNEGVYQIHYDYQTEKFTEHEIEMLHAHIMNLLFGGIADDSKKLYELNVLTDDEKQKLFFDFNDTAVEYPKDKCVHTLFEEQVKKIPDKTAVIACDKTLTYRELNEEANRIAHSLIKKGVGVGDIVAFALPRKSYLIATMLGILKSGAAYLPVDPDYPQDRIDYMLEDSNAKLCITEENIDSLIRDSCKDNPSVSISGNSLCYCIYTSGSTGKPKGTLIKNTNLSNYINSLVKIYGSNNINMPFFTSECVDLSVTSIYFPLVTGWTVYMYSSQVENSLNDIVDNANISIIKLTPTHIKMMCKLYKHRIMYNIKHIIIGGEALYKDDAEKFLRSFGKHILIHNEYGPTETTVGCMDYIYNNTEINQNISIGKPIANTQIYIVDKYMKPTPIGVTGELCIAGDCVGAGYLNRPELTVEKFIDNPFGKGKLYKTGDLAYWRDDGNIVYVGRNDFQVKIRGLRIELGEIENAISSIDGVSQAVVVVRKDENGRQLICAFYAGDEIDAKEIRNRIGKKLPKYMLPHIFTHINKMPMTSSGKVNRKALPEVDLHNINNNIEFVAPQTEKEVALVNAIENTLGIDKVGIMDNFFDLGGDSIKAIYIVAELQNKGYELQVSAIMQSDTIADLAELMKSAEIKREYIQDEVSGETELSPLMKAYLKGKPASPEMFMQSCIIEANCSEEELKKALDEIISHHDILRAVVKEDGLLIRKSEDAEAYSFETINENENPIEYLKNIKVRFDMENGPLVSVALCLTENGCIFRLSIHHFVIDLVSWKILLEDLRTALEQLKKNELIRLPSKTASFSEWSEALNEYKAQIMNDDEREYWKETGEKLEKAIPLFKEDSTNLHEESYNVTLDKETTDKLINEANNAFKTRPNELLLTALGLAANEMTGGRVGILAESHGRAELKNHIFVGRTIGWFTSMYPVVFENTSDISDMVIEAKDTIRHTPYNGIGYMLTAESLSDNASIIFNYFNGETKQNESEVNLVDFVNNGSVFPGKIVVDCSLLNGKLNISVGLSAYTKKQQLTEQLALLFEGKIEELIDVCISTESDYKDIYSLTPAQEGMYYQYRINPLSKIYHLIFVFEIGKETDIELLEKSVELLSIRHEILNTAILVTKSSVKQIISGNRKPDFKVKTMGTTYSQSALEESVGEIEEEKIDLQKDTLFRVRIIDFNDKRYMVIYTHHIILDGWSMPVLLKDLDGIYKKLSEGISVSEMSKTIQKEAGQNASFSDYVSLRMHRNKSKALEYWKELFRDYEPSKLFENSRKANGKGNKITEVLVGELSAEVRKYAKKHKLSLNAIFESAFGILLQKYSASEDVAFCKPISGRTVPLKGIENAAGPFINTVLSRIRSSDGKTVEELFNEVQNQSVETNRLGYLSLSELYRECSIAKDSVDVLFAFENYYIDGSDIIEKSALKLKPVSNHEQTEFPLSVSVIPIGGEFNITVNYSRQHFTENQISDLIDSYVFILRQITEDKTINTSDIKSLTEKQLQKLADFNDTAFEYPEAESIYELFEKTVSARKSELCIESSDKSITFGEFKKSVEVLDCEIRKHTNGEKSAVAVIANRSVEMYAAIYAIIRGGNAYMPVSPDYPKDRIEFMLKDSGASLALVQSEYTDLAYDLPCIDISTFDYDKKNEEQTSCLAKPDDAAYIIYTSGSTGTPKGTMISHKSAINRILWMQKTYPLDENSVILQKTPYTFDVSVWELFWWGMCNGHLAAMNPNEHFVPASILDDCEKYAVTHLHFVPSVFDLFLSYLESHRERTESFRTVKHVFLSGEALSAELVNRFYAIFDFKVKLHNLYGPTECAVDVTYYDCKKEEVNPIPIGKPIDNTQMYVVDRYMNLVPIGVTGELCIGGANVGIGYLNRPGLTAEKFIDNPFGEGKLYRTGDLAYIRDDGEIIFCGRKDFQVKLNGQRIELGEIEAVIAQHEKVEASAVVVREHNERDILVSYYTGKEISSKEMKDLCREKLPKYMIPTAFIHLEKLPLNSSGKLDRKMLSSFVLSEFGFTETFEEPVNETERMICEAFKEVLDANAVDRNTDFYDIGGTSLDIIILLSDERFKDITASDLIINSTPAKLAKFMEKKKESSFRKLQCLAETKNAKKAVVMFPYAGGSPAAFSALSKELMKADNSVSVYYIDFPDKAEECDEIANEVITLSKNVEVSFYAHCVGSVVALQVAEIIEKKNVPVLRNIIIGGNIPPKKGAKYNLWNIVPDSALTAILKKAGGRLNELPNETRKKLLADFRRNTDYAVAYYKTPGHKLNIPIKVIISKDDLFTRNYRDAETSWKKYGNDVTVEFIESKSHYFQSDMADDVAKRIEDIIC